MLTGLNTEIAYQGERYHVQTEDGGAAHPVITTLLYKEGAVLFSKRTNYVALGEEDPIRVLMKEQHKAVLKDLLAGKIPAVLPKGDV